METEKDKKREEKKIIRDTTLITGAIFGPSPIVHTASFI